MLTTHLKITAVKVTIIFFIFIGAIDANAQVIIGYEITAQDIHTTDCVTNDTPYSKTTPVLDRTLIPPFAFYYIPTPHICPNTYYTQIRDSTGRWVDIGHYGLSNPGNHPSGVIGKSGGAISWTPIYAENQFGSHCEQGVGN